ncbi:hypothetical protein DXG01_012120 [Tephrocybe rancida]|nr:hypothetical protein DXG01_012120 [Tephrocybe rancida]
MDWDEEYDLLAARGAAPGRSTFIDRARNASPDDDDVAIAAARPVDVPLILPVEEETPLQQLMRHWTNERNCPDILPAQEELLVTVLDHIRRQSQTVQLLREDASTSEDEHVRIVLAQTEMERVKFIVRSYVRTRHYKSRNLIKPVLFLYTRYKIVLQSDCQSKPSSSWDVLSSEAILQRNGFRDAKKPHLAGPILRRRAARRTGRG